MLLTNQQILSLSEAILALDGRHSLKVVEGKPVAQFTSYSLDHKARWNLARNAGRLQSAAADFNRAKDALINHHSQGKGSLAQTDPEFKPFSQKLEMLKQETQELPLVSVPLAGLNLESNDIPIAVLTALQPVISDE